MEVWERVTDCWGVIWSIIGLILEYGGVTRSMGVFNSIRVCDRVSGGGVGAVESVRMSY